MKSKQIKLNQSECCWVFQTLELFLKALSFVAVNKHLKIIEMQGKSLQLNFLSLPELSILKYFWA